jgi:hypothetical protein
LFLLPLKIVQNAFDVKLLMFMIVHAVNPAEVGGFFLDFEWRQDMGFLLVICNFETESLLFWTIV